MFFVMFVMIITVKMMLMMMIRGALTKKYGII